MLLQIQVWGTYWSSVYVNAYYYYTTCTCCIYSVTLTVLQSHSSLLMTTILIIAHKLSSMNMIDNLMVKISQSLVVAKLPQS